jgi:hypothetical protein
MGGEQAVCLRYNAPIAEDGSNKMRPRAIAQANQVVSWPYGEAGLQSFQRDRRFETWSEKDEPRIGTDDPEHTSTMLSVASFQI